MEDRIVKALRALGLSEDMVAYFLDLIASGKSRITTDGLVTRKRAPVKARGVEHPNELNKGRKPRRAIRVTYRPKATGPTVAQEIARLETRLTREIPYWQRRNYEARLDGLLRTGKTYQESASETLAGIDRERGRKRVT